MHNRNSLKLSQHQEVVVARYDEICLNSYRTFEDAIVRRIFKYGDLAHRPDDCCRPANHLQHRSDVLFWLGKLLAKNPSGLGENWHRRIEGNFPPMRQEKRLQKLTGSLLDFALSEDSV